VAAAEASLHTTTDGAGPLGQRRRARLGVSATPSRLPPER